MIIGKGTHEQSQRVLEEVKLAKAANRTCVVIVVAGMEGALPSVIAGAARHAEQLQDIFYFAGVDAGTSVTTV